MKFVAFVLSCVALFAIDPSAALDQLMQGNQRFVKNRMEYPNQGVKRRLSLTKGQSPFAVVVACSDSRVVPEIVFDQGLGDIFVIRVAGNVVGPYEIESILYSVKYLNSSCVLVLGHGDCGAVEVVVENRDQEVPFLAQLIKPSVEKAKASKAKDVLTSAIKYNAENMAEFVSKFEKIAPFVSKNEVVVKAAYYDMESGKVQLI